MISGWDLNSPRGKAAVRLLWVSSMIILWYQYQRYILKGHSLIAHSWSHLYIIHDLTLNITTSMGNLAIKSFIISSTNSCLQRYILNGQANILSMVTPSLTTNHHKHPIVTLPFSALKTFLKITFPTETKTRPEYGLGLLMTETVLMLIHNVYFILLTFKIQNRDKNAWLSLGPCLLIYICLLLLIGRKSLHKSCGDSLHFVLCNTRLGSKCFF